MIDDLARITGEMDAHLAGLAGFWKQRGVDPEGGYLTCFDAEGRTGREPLKTLVAQTRVLWTYAALAEATGDGDFAALAARGVEYLEAQFWDRRWGGWFWSVEDGVPKDRAKLMYGQSFALYALATCAQVTGDARAAALAEETFVAMHRAVDARFGGFWENLDQAWNPENSPSGRRKSLDIHLHLMESFTVLAALTRDSTHVRRLVEIRRLLLERMIDGASGVGGNQYLEDFTPVEPIVIDRTWIAERLDGEVLPPGQFTTSYGHNLELGWLLGAADEVTGDGVAHHRALVDRLAAHALRFGFDEEHGGVYREGPPVGRASDEDKEFWQNAEALIGFLHAYQLTGRDDYAQAFAATWGFARQHLVHPEMSEWRIRTTREGAVVDAALGNQWTGGYHTVRAAIECSRRLGAIIGGC
jgi:mannobiose 2-epimerase